MLGPPLRGSEIANSLAVLPPYRWLMGPAAMELTTAARSDMPAPSYELGIIAGTMGWAYPLGSLLLPRPHDGRVALARTRIAGLAGHVTVHAMHGFLMNRPDVQRQALAFLRTGRFDET